LRVVIDTNVIFEGLTRKDGAPGLLIDACMAGLLQICVSNALAYEYMDILSRKLSAQRWETLRPVLGCLLKGAEFITVHYSWRPISPDPGDDHVIDCAMNGAAKVITLNVRDFKQAEASLGLEVLTPEEAIAALVKGG
jgi:putative PIN family toxin of toxin-antitoxin system